tara:strand:- start:874 stop:1155 length:282 start_codon:yes stop_codon:yes gene_type:complete
MKVVEFAEYIEKQSKIQLMKHKLDCEANWKNAETHIHYGRKWTRVDVGPSGRYMIDPDGNIYGIKAYGVPHLGHYFGTLEAPKGLGDHWGAFS